MIAIVAALSAVEAMLGRLLHANSNPMALFVFVSVNLALYSQASFPTRTTGATFGVLAALLYASTYSAFAALLVGWNDSLPYVMSPAAVTEVAVAGLIGGFMGAINWKRTPSVTEAPAAGTAAR
ncbi:MAG: hypothetical protein V4617_18640 [Gemmatimonadota bacterium]